MTHSSRASTRQPSVSLDITVLNCSSLSDPLPGVRRVVIMRGTPLGNPYPMRNRSLEERIRVVAAYGPWLRNQWRSHGPARAELERLYAIAQHQPLELVCCCAPLACHGDVVRTALLGIHSKRAQPA